MNEWTDQFIKNIQVIKGRLKGHNKSPQCVKEYNTEVEAIFFFVAPRIKMESPEIQIVA